ncbi:Polysaccharide biosynthesis protein CapD-like domain protein, partial [mine drainage metagenome]
PIRIQDLAEAMIRVSGFIPGHDIRIVHTGLRPGEKLHEELFYQDEKLRQSSHPKLLLAQGHVTDLEVLKRGLDHLLETLASGDNERVVRVLQTLVPSYMPRREVEKSAASSLPS